MQASEVVIGDDRLEMTRFFGYPREAVFEAWTDPGQVEKWWGCAETERVESEIDLRVGGSFRHTMHIRTAGEVAYEGVYDEIDRPSKLVTSCEMGAGTEYAFRSTTTIEFIEQEGGTLVKLTQVGLPPMPNCGEIISGGFNAAFEKLDGHLERAR